MAMTSGDKRLVLSSQIFCKKIQEAKNDFKYAKGSVIERTCVAQLELLVE